MTEPQVYDSANLAQKHSSLLTSNNAEADLVTRNFTEQHVVPKAEIVKEENTVTVAGALQVFEGYGELEDSLWKGHVFHHEHPLKQVVSKPATFSLEPPEQRTKAVTETPTQRVSRLRGEADELMQLVDEHKKQFQVQGDAWSEEAQRVFERRFGCSPSDLVANISQLKAEIDRLEADEEVTAWLRGEIPGGKPGKGQTKEDVRLANMAKISALIEESTPAKAEGKTTSYELYLKEPRSLHQLDVSRLVLLEEQLSKIEEVLGVASNRALCNQIAFGDMHESLVEIGSRLMLVDQMNIDNVGRRVKTLSDEIDAVLSKSSQHRSGGNLMMGMDSGTASLEPLQISELYDLCRRWRQLGGLMPHLIRRMQTLQVIHEEAGTLVEKVSSLEKEQSKLQEVVKTTSERVDAFEAAVTSNLRKMQQFVEQHVANS